MRLACPRSGPFTNHNVGNIFTKKLIWMCRFRRRYQKVISIIICCFSKHSYQIQRHLKLCIFSIRILLLEILNVHWYYCKMPVQICNSHIQTILDIYFYKGPFINYVVKRDRQTVKKPRFLTIFTKQCHRLTIEVGFIDLMTQVTLYT